MIDLPIIFTVLMGAAILAYVVLDGYDLGVGMLMPAASRDEQNRMVASIGPFWDANETWLVLGIGLLLVAFPAAHGEILGALYLPVAAMLVGLMLRGVAFELRIKAEGWHRELWNWLFWAGSTLASLAQGFMLGRYITGFAPGLDYWLFALVVAGGLCGGYVLLGATWLVFKTEGALQKVARTLTRPLVLVVVAFMGLVSAWLPFLDSRIMARWFEGGHFWWLAPVPLLALANAFALWRAVMQDGRDARPFVLTLAFFALGFAGLVLGIWPNLVPPDLSIWAAASPPSSQGFVLAGLVVLLPAILGYTWWSYSVFRGKVAVDSGYH